MTSRRSRAAVISFAVVFVLSQAALACVLEFGPVRLRDPEYGVKETRLHRLKRRNPEVAVTVAFGSSRVAGGLRPSALTGEHRLFNFGLVGAAPITQRLALERVLRSGLRPDTVIFEYWPPYLFECGEQVEEDRLETHRLGREDLAVIGPYLRDWRGREQELSAGRLLSIWSHRVVIVNLLAHLWLPFEKRQEFRWRPVDAVGWVPGPPADTDPDHRPIRLAMSRQYFQPFLAADRFHPVNVRAFEDLLEFCRDERLPVILLWLPEASEFRSWYSSDAENVAQRYFAAWSSRPGVRGINARCWIADERMRDGFHLDPTGAKLLTTRLADTIRGNP